MRLAPARNSATSERPETDPGRTWLLLAKIDDPGAGLGNLSTGHRDRSGQKETFEPVSSPAAARLNSSSHWLRTDRGEAGLPHPGVTHLITGR